MLDLDDFWIEVSRCLIPGADWGRNFDAFNDILRGGFGTPDGGFTLKWVNSDAARATLGYEETTRYLERKLSKCHPTAIPIIQDELAKAQSKEGPTLFEMIVDIIRDHGPGGEEEADGVELDLR